VAARVDVRERCLFGLTLIALVASCLVFAARLDGPTVARWELADAGVLMSCADEPSSRDEPLWCESPDSPHCTRGTPAPESREPWLGPLLAAHVDALTAPTYDHAPLCGRPGAAALLGHAWTDGERLERPPRRA
jgi:hypothetical protein